MPITRSDRVPHDSTICFVSELMVSREVYVEVEHS